KRSTILLLCIAVTMAAGRGFLSRGAFAGKKENVVGGVPSYRNQVRPLLQAKCYRCHGDQRRRADLDLRTPAGILAGGESGPVIVPGKPEKSLLFEKIHGGLMPPGKKDRLSEAEVEILR